MVMRLTQDARRQVLSSAAEEARRRGDRRIGTDHLLLGLLHDPGSLAEQILGMDLDAAREASNALDRAALAAVGVDVGDFTPAATRPGRGRPPFTSAARAVLHGSVIEARDARARHIDERHLLLALLARTRPDPAAELLAALDVDPVEATARLRRSVQ